MDKDVQAKYQESGPTLTPSENTQISDKTIHGHNCIDYSSTEQPNAPGKWLMPITSSHCLWEQKEWLR